MVDGTQVVTLTAMADGYTDGGVTLEVTDDDVAALTVTLIPERVPETAARPTAQFEDVGLLLGDESSWIGADGSGEFVTGGVAFHNEYDSTWGSWAGWAYANRTDTTTPGWGNQYSAYPAREHTGRQRTEWPMREARCLAWN